MTTATFAIGGMHCAACAVRNERTLRKIPGVRDANVNLGTRRAPKGHNPPGREKLAEDFFENVLACASRPVYISNQRVS